MAKEKNSPNNIIIVDGRYLTQKVTGVQRLAIELIRAFKEIKDLKIIVAMPPNAPEMPNEDKNISYVKVGKLKENMWEQWSLPLFCKKKKLPLLCTGNLAPILSKNYVFIHDVTFKEKHDYQEKKSWLRKIKFMTRAIIYRSKAVFTVSEFSADRIVHFYPRLKTHTIVTYNGYEHVLGWQEEEIKDISGDFYFSVGTTNPNKNFIYVLELAKANPDKNFIIAGKPAKQFTDFIEEHNIRNFRFLGFVTDGQMAWLYRHCKGFILPSVYEGFGLPPLEAVASGCRALYLSDIDVFKEVYGDMAKYFNPHDYENTVILDDKATMTEVQVEALLKKCSWKTMAEKVAEVIFKR